MECIPPQSVLPVSDVPVRKPERVRRLGAVDAEALRKAAAGLPDAVWRRQDAIKENRWPCFSHTRHIVFRFASFTSGRRRCYATLFWAAWRELLLPVMRQAAAPYGFAEPFHPKAMLARLAAGESISTHEDQGGMNPLAHKIHIPLETGPLATLTVRGESFHLQAGHAFEVNNLVPHGAFNGEARDRIHFIFEVCEGAGRSGGARAP